MPQFTPSNSMLEDFKLSLHSLANGNAHAHSRSRPVAGDMDSVISSARHILDAATDKLPDLVIEILRGTLLYLPRELGGLLNFSTWLTSHDSPDDLLQMARYIITHLLLPVRQQGSVQLPELPYIDEQFDLYDAKFNTDEYLSHDAQRFREAHMLHKDTLKRDGFRCFLTGARDMDYAVGTCPGGEIEPMGENEVEATTHMVPILPLDDYPCGYELHLDINDPFFMTPRWGKWPVIKGHTDDRKTYEEDRERFKHACAFFFPELVQRPTRSHGCGKLRNVLTLTSQLEDHFRKLRMSLRPIGRHDTWSTAKMYEVEVCVVPNFRKLQFSSYLRQCFSDPAIDKLSETKIKVKVPASGTLPQGLPLPSPFFLQAHSAITAIWQHVDGDSHFLQLPVYMRENTQEAAEVLLGCNRQMPAEGNDTEIPGGTNMEETTATPPNGAVLDSSMPGALNAVLGHDDDILAQVDAELDQVMREPKFVEMDGEMVEEKTFLARKEAEIKLQMMFRERDRCRMIQDLLDQKAHELDADEDPVICFLVQWDGDIGLQSEREGIFMASEDKLVFHSDY